MSDLAALIFSFLFHFIMWWWYQRIYLLRNNVKFHINIPRFIIIKFKLFIEIEKGKLLRNSVCYLIFSANWLFKNSLISLNFLIFSWWRSDKNQENFASFSTNNTRLRIIKKKAQILVFNFNFSVMKIDWRKGTMNVRGRGINRAKIKRDLKGT